MDVCFPLMRSSQYELNLFHENPHQFVYLAVDTCNEQVLDFVYQILIFSLGITDIKNSSNSVT